MEKEKQIKLIETFMDEMKKEILSKAEKFPDNWNGFEIRHYIAMKFNSEDIMSKDNQYKPTSYRTRRRNCENDILVFNL